MKEKNESKMKLKTAIILMVLLVVIILVGIIGIKVHNEIKANNEKVSGENLNLAETFEFVMDFAKMENNKENMIYSPLSIKYALKMLSEGANGNTKDQIENVIGNLNLINYNSIEDVLSLANGMYVRDNYKKDIKEDYKNTLIQKYNAEIKYDSFSNANNINNWIEDKTLGIIKNMLDDGLVQDPNLQMILINALAIDMEWEDRFDGTDTYGEDFYLENGDIMEATTMHNQTSSESVSYYKDKNITALTINLQKYDDTQLEFVAIMPEDNLSDYVENLTVDDFNKITKKLTLASETKDGVNISIPRFSYQYDLKLKDNLINLGITEAFNGNSADFSNISDKGLGIGEALHKANIDFTERGIKAAAVTAIAMKTNSLVSNPTKPEEIKIDRPFLYLIKDKNTGEIWFVGTVYEPNSWEEDKENYN